MSAETGLLILSLISEEREDEEIAGSDITLLIKNDSSLEERRGGLPDRGLD